MTPKEKAKELVDKYIPHTRVFHEVLGWEDYIDSAKQCALIAIDEIIQATKQYSYSVGYGMLTQDKYWQEVKTEIENL
jgi:hypothetical protein